MGADHAPQAPVVAEIGELLERVGAASGRRPLSSDRWRALEHVSSRPPGPDGADGRTDLGTGPDAFVALLARRGPGRPLVGYAQVDAGGGHDPAVPYVVEVVAEPGPGAGEVADVLVAAAVRAVRGSGGGNVRLWTPGAAEADDRRAATNGFAAERDLLQMRCRLPLDPRAQTGRPRVAVRTRPFRVGVDEDTWLALNNRAFATHPEQGHWDLATLLEREHEPWFDPSGFLVAEEAGRMAGWCWTKVHAHTRPPMGEIYVIGVDPELQGRGWGRALTQAGFDWLAEQGLAVGMLYVDAANTAAVSLYRSMGLTVDHVDRSYVASVDGTVTPSSAG